MGQILPGKGRLPALDAFIHLRPGKVAPLAANAIVVTISRRLRRPACTFAEQAIQGSRYLDGNEVRWLLPHVLHVLLAFLFLLKVY
jgi:hypothetical protein